MVRRASSGILLRLEFIPQNVHLYIYIYTWMRSLAPRLPCFLSMYLFFCFPPPSPFLSRERRGTFSPELLTQCRQRVGDELAAAMDEKSKEGGKDNNGKDEGKREVKKR